MVGIIDACDPLQPPLVDQRRFFRRGNHEIPAVRVRLFQRLRHQRLLHQMAGAQQAIVEIACNAQMRKALDVERVAPARCAEDHRADVGGFQPLEGIEGAGIERNLVLDDAPLIDDQTVEAIDNCG